MPSSRPSTTLLLLLLSAHSATADGDTCYYPDNSPATGYVWEKCALGGSADANAPCCTQGNICQTNGLCYDNRAGKLYRGACTDRSFTDPACPKYCISGVAASTWTWVQECQVFNDSSGVPSEPPLACGAVVGSDHLNASCQHPDPNFAIQTASESFSQPTATATPTTTDSAGTTDSSSGTTDSSSGTTDSSSGTLSAGAIAGIAVGAAAVAAIAAAAALWFFLRRKKAAAAAKSAAEQQGAGAAGGSGGEKNGIVEQGQEKFYGQEPGVGYVTHAELGPEQQQYPPPTDGFAAPGYATETDGIPVSELQGPSYTPQAVGGQVSELQSGGQVSELQSGGYGPVPQYGELGHMGELEGSGART